MEGGLPRLPMPPTPRASARRRCCFTCGVTRWADADDDWPYQRFTFAASVAGSVTALGGPHPAPPDPGHHAHTGGALELVLSACSVLALVDYHARRAELRPQ
jgi:hypothetical protein